MWLRVFISNARRIINRRWHCLTFFRIPRTRDAATREQAYVYAISSAAITYTMARACASGNLYQCACAVPPREPPMGNFKWGGCGDNIKWGMHFAKRFVDTIEKQNARKPPDGEPEDKKISAKMRTYTAAVNLHNNKIGRKVYSQKLA